MLRKRTGISAGQDPPTAERELLAAVARRDRRAFAELYRQYRPRLHAYLRRILGNAAIAEEVFDDVMFIVWKDARKFRGDSAISSWIFGIAYRKAMTAARRERRHARAVDPAVDVDSLPLQGEGDANLIAVALQGLSADHRQVVELTYLCGFSYKEIAEIADCPVNTVKTRMFHARRRLRHLLPTLAGDDKERTREQQ